MTREINHQKIPYTFHTLGKPLSCSYFGLGWYNKFVNNDKSSCTEYDYVSTNFNDIRKYTHRKWLSKTHHLCSISNWTTSLEQLLWINRFARSHKTANIVWYIKIYIYINTCANKRPVKNYFVAIYSRFLGNVLITVYVDALRKNFSNSHFKRLKLLIKCIGIDSFFPYRLYIIVHLMHYEICKSVVSYAADK